MTDADRIAVVEVELGERAYGIAIGHGLLQDAEQWRAAMPSQAAVLVVTNDIVARWYLAPLLARLPVPATVLVLPDGESSKSIATAERIFSALAEARITRDGSVIALGGGVIGDLAGFAAACWMRGVRCVQVPTTLLAMVDSAVGGKTGVNLPQGKNLVGAFHQPARVIADLSTLDTLPDRELRAGLAEVIKYGAIGDAAFFSWLETNVTELLARKRDALMHAVTESCRHKARIVTRDEREDGERALLNFGHTFAHALEQVSGYSRFLHGEAVAIGMLQAARLSSRLGMAPPSDAERLASLLQACSLPTECPRELEGERLIEAMRLDKKADSSGLRFVLWRGIGRAEVVSGVPMAAVRALLAEG